MLADHRQIIKTASNFKDPKQKRRFGTALNEITLGRGFSIRHKQLFAEHKSEKQNEALT